MTFGVSAQDLQNSFPELVHQMKDSEYLSVDYVKFGVLAIQAIKEQQQMINQLEENQRKMEEKIKMLENIINKNN